MTRKQREVEIDMFSHEPIKVPHPGGFGCARRGYPIAMLYTIFIILAIVALVLFIFGRRSI